jgi:hypothetical protein
MSKNAQRTGSAVTAGGGAKVGGALSLHSPGLLAGVAGLGSAKFILGSMLCIHAARSERPGLILFILKILLIMSKIPGPDVQDHESRSLQYARSMCEKQLTISPAESAASVLAIPAQRQSITKKCAECQHEEGDWLERMNMGNEIRKAVVSNERRGAPLDKETECESGNATNHCEKI